MCPCPHSRRNETTKPKRHQEIPDSQGPALEAAVRSWPPRSFARRRIVWGAKIYERGDLIPDQLAGNKVKLRRFWDSGVIELWEENPEPEPDVKAGEESQAPRERKTKRDGAIVQAVMSGRSMVDVAREQGITRQTVLRVMQRDAPAWHRPPAKSNADRQRRFKEKRKQQRRGGKHER